MNRFVTVDATYPRVPSPGTAQVTVRIRQVNIFTWLSREYDNRSQDYLALKARRLLEAQGVSVPTRLDYADLELVKLEPTR